MKRFEETENEIPTTTTTTGETNENQRPKQKSKGITTPKGRQPQQPNEGGEGEWSRDMGIMIVFFYNDEYDTEDRNRLQDTRNSTSTISRGPQQYQLQLNQDCGMSVQNG